MSQPHDSRICLRVGLRTCTRTTIAWLGLPSCVTPVNTLTAPAWGRALAHPVSPEGDDGWIRALSTTGLVWAVLRRYGNINPLSIDYACRPRLRSRLTQGGLTWPWNPWSFGGRVSHPSFATHACILTRPQSTRSYPLASPRERRSPTHPAKLNATVSAVYLSPATLSARNHLTSELLRTLSRVAASKPTSWLSLRSHILFHLAHA